MAQGGQGQAQGQGPDGGQGQGQSQAPGRSRRATGTPSSNVANSGDNPNNVRNEIASVALTPVELTNRPQRR